MNDEEKWNSGNAPQNDRDTGRFNEPQRYEHYNMHQSYVNETGQESGKKKRRKKSGGRKLASTISLAVVFGLVAGVVFQCVNFFAAQYMGTTTADAEPQIETAQLAVSASSDDAASEGTDSSENGTADAAQSVSAANGVYAMSAITALTAQNTTGVTDIMEVTPKFLAEQLDCIFTDIRPDAVKTGMVSSSELIEVIADKLTEYKAKNIVIDPVMVATSGARLISEDAISTLKTKLLPLATVITPNIPEAEVLCGMEIKTEADMEKAAEAICNSLGCAVSDVSHIAWIRACKDCA